MKEDILEMQNKNKAFQKHKKMYLIRSEYGNCRFTKYEKKLMKKKMKKLGMKNLSEFILFCVMEQIKDDYDEEEINKWHHLFDDYKGGYDGRSWKQVPQ